MKKRTYTHKQDQENKYFYEGYIITDERTKQSVYDGAGYLFNNETKCFFKGTWSQGDKICGIETFPNGDVYEGGYFEGKFNGLGLLYNNTKGTYKYEGNFHNGMKEGQGKEQYCSGGSYDGSYKGNQKHGHGTLTFADGSYYIGEFQRGMPNGFGLHVAHQKQRIVSIFPIPQEKEQNQEGQDEDDESFNQEEENANDKQKNEYLYEGHFVDGYKHGLGRLYEPSGSYFYGYWEYNKPTRQFVYYEANGNRWKLLEIPQLQKCQSINFYQILSDAQWEKLEYKATGYPNNQVDGFKCMIDEKGLKREHFEDPEFSFADDQIMIRDENGTQIPAPIEFQRIYNLPYYQENSFQLFNDKIDKGYLIYQEQYCCQQLTQVLDALTYHNYLLQKCISRKYEAEIGFYYVNLFIENEWKEVVLDDLIPVFKLVQGYKIQLPVYSNSPNNDLAWVLLFKAIAKYYGNLCYFESIKEQRAAKYLTLLTGMPTVTLEVPNEQGNIERYNEQQLKFWRKLTEKYQSTQVRMGYLEKTAAAKFSISSNCYAFHIVDSAVANSKQGETHILLIKSLLSRYSIKTDISESYYLEKQDRHFINAINKIKENNPQIQDDNRYFFLTYRDFLRYFQSVCILCTTKYTVQSSLLVIPEDNDKYNNEFRFFVKFSVNLPQQFYITVIQEHIDQVDEHGKTIYSEHKFPIRIVLAREKDLYTNKNQIRKKIAHHWQDKAIQGQQERIKSGKFNTEEQRIFSSLLPQQHEKKKEKPYKYIFGRGQQASREISKQVSLESGSYTLFVQVEVGDYKQKFQELKNMRFWVMIYGQSLLQLLQQPQIQEFQKRVYESAILQAEKLYKDKPNNKFYYKGDLSEQENGSSDLVITQYFIKKEGTYLQYLNNRSNNKIWRQKLTFKLENMIILDQRDNSKLDLQLSKKETALVIIQQVGALPYNFEGGEGICIVDFLNDQREEDIEQIKDSEEVEENEDQIRQEEDKPIFLQKFNEQKK